jgi:hypothetical protein
LNGAPSRAAQPSSEASCIALPRFSITFLKSEPSLAVLVRQAGGALTLT